VDLSPDNRHAKVVVPADQVSKAIGKGGVNIRLASQLTECEIDVYREVEEEDDIDIFEFVEDFGDEVTQAIFDMGCDTARDVLNLGAKELYRRLDGRIDMDTANKIVKTIELEFEDDNMG
jgi:N utilization substance protein A